MAKLEALHVNDELALPGREIVTSFARSGGPGGQNVNKVESKVILHFCIDDSRALSDEQRQRLHARLGSRLTTAGEIVIQAARHRERERNLVDARERLAALLRAALAVPKTRRPTRPTKSSGKRRLAGKRRRSDVKRERRTGLEE